MIIKKIKVNKDFYPKEELNKVILKRYKIWKNIYTSNEPVTNLFSSI